MNGYKQGDIVRVWSEQSFFHGGFIEGDHGIVYQDTHEDGSVMVTLIRNIESEMMVDFSYEVYPQQVKLECEASQATFETFDNFKEYFSSDHPRRREKDGCYSKKAVKPFIKILTDALAVIGKTPIIGDIERMDTSQPYPQMEKPHFGKVLRKMRLEKAKMNLRVFAHRIGMAPSALSKIELGYEDYPRSDTWLEKVITAIGLSEVDDADELIEAFIRPFQRQRMPENIFPLFAHHSDGSPATRDEMLRLAEHMISEARRHNALVDQESQGKKSQNAEE